MEIDKKIKKKSYIQSRRKLNRQPNKKFLGVRLERRHKIFGVVFGIVFWIVLLIVIKVYLI